MIKHAKAPKIMLKNTEIHEWKKMLIKVRLGIFAFKPDKHVYKIKL